MQARIAREDLAGYRNTIRGGFAKTETSQGLTRRSALLSACETCCRDCECRVCASNGPTATATRPDELESITKRGRVLRAIPWQPRAVLATRRSAQSALTPQWNGAKSFCCISTKAFSLQSRCNSSCVETSDHRARACSTISEGQSFFFADTT